METLFHQSVELKCKNCKHWAPHEGDAEHGECSGEKLLLGKHYVEVTLNYLDEGGCSIYSIETPKDFFCANFEAKTILQEVTITTT